MAATRRKGGRVGASGGRLGLVWEDLNSSFWFVPALLVLGAVVLYAGMQYLDQLFGANLGALPVVFSGDATAARSVLSTIAGGLVTVTGTVFPLTIVTLQLASSYYSPRVLKNFTGDRGVQAVLGTYVATFLYSLLVLRVIRTPVGEGAAFNPVISMTVAVLLALVCVALLIYFIAHIVNLIQSSTIVSGAHRDTVRTLAGLDDLDGAPPAEPKVPEDRPEIAGLLARDPLVVRARKSGYVQHLDVDAAVDAVAGEAGAEKTVIVELPFGPGHFVAAGLPILRAWHAGEPGSGAEDAVLDAFYFGKERSFRQDFAFGLRQLSDIALTALSPSFNDSTTAMQAMDRMEAIFIALGQKALPARVREEGANGTKVLAKIGFYDFEDVVGLAFDQIRRTAFTSGQVAVLERLLEILDRAILANPLPERRRALWARAHTVARLAPDQVPDPHDAANLVLKAVGVGARLPYAEVRADLEDLTALSEGLRGGDRVREAIRRVRECPGR